MNGLIFYSEMKFKVVNPDKEKESRKRLRISCGRRWRGGGGVEWKED